MNITIIRDTFTAAETLGKLSIGHFVFDTIEQPRNHDEPGHSCVPPGTYELVPHISSRLHEDDGVTPLHTFALVNPALGITHSPDDTLPGGIGYPHRSECLIHPANYASQLEGCIAPGSDRSHVLGNGGWMVTNSRESFKIIRQALEGDPGPHTLTIQEAAQG